MGDTDYVKIYLTEMGHERGDWIELTQNVTQIQDILNIGFLNS
jgi:hypothetical protein